MSWRRVDGADAQSRGLFTEIPFRGYTGWLCNYPIPLYLVEEELSAANDIIEIIDAIEVVNNSLACVSRFVDLSSFDSENP